MPRSLKAAVALAILPLLTGVAQGAIFPDHLGTYERSAPKTIGTPDKELYDEYGLEATESANYTSPDKKPISVTAWKLHDSTGALALFDSRLPPGATQSDFAQVAVHTSDGTIFIFGNYVFQFTGGTFDQPTLNELYTQLPRVENAPLAGAFELSSPRGPGRQLRTLYFGTGRAPEGRAGDTALGRGIPHGRRGPVRPVPDP